MSSLILWGSGFIVALVILDRLPGLRHLIQPVISGISRLAQVLLGSGAAWLIFGLKTVVRDHLSLLRHLASRRVSIDPADEMRWSAQGQIAEPRGVLEQWRALGKWFQNFRRRNK